jgi:hypothetical protein
VVIEIKPEPEPGWSPSLWPKRMTLERICLEARLLSWKQLFGFLALCVAMIGVGIFCLWEVFYSQIVVRRGLAWILGIVTPPLFGFIALYVIAIMMAKLIVVPRTEADIDLGNIERLLPISRKKPDQS